MPEGNTISSSLLAKILNGLYGNEPVSFAIFLKDYVIEGAQYTITPGNPKRFTISPSIIALGDEMYRTNEPKSFQTNAPNTTYYVDYVAGKGYRFSVDHPLDLHLMLWRIETGSNGAINSAVDLRGTVGGVQFDDNISLIPDLIVNTENIVNSSVTTAKLADGSVTTPKLANGAVVTAKIGTGAVVTTNLGDGSVTTDKISNSAVTSVKIADANVITNKIADNAVTTAKVNNGAITTPKINDGAITSDKLDTNSVTNLKIVDNAVITSKIQNGAVTTDKINNLGVTSGKIADSAVTEAKINNSAVTAGKIASNAVTTVKINNGAVTLPKLGTDVINYIDSIEGETNLSDLQDVDVNTRADGRVLAWDEDSNSYVFVEQTGGGGEVETNFQVNQKIFTATSNQTVFDITDTGMYETGKNYLKVWVAGVIQVLTTNFVETSSTSFTLTSGVPSGTQVIAEWFEGVGTGGGGGGASNLSDLDDVNPAAKADGRILQWNASSSKHVYVNPTTTPSAHAASHLTGGSDAIPVAVAGVSPGLMSAAQALSLADVVEDVGDLSGLPAQVGGLDSDVSDLQSSVGDLISDVGDLSSTVGGLSSTVGGLSSTVGGLSSSVGDLEDTVSALSSEVSGLSGLSSAVSDLSDDVSDLSDAVGNMSTVTTTSKVVAGAINELKAQSALKGPSTAPGFPLTLTVGSGKQFSTIQAAFDTINDRYVSGNIIIDIDAGTYAESPVMKGVSGPCVINIRPSTGVILDNSAPIVITGSSGLSFVACTANIDLWNIRLTSSSSSSAFKVVRCSRVGFSYCCRTVSNGSICFDLDSSNVSIFSGEYSNQSFLLSAFYSNINIGSITASDNYIGIRGVASLLVVQGDLGAATFTDPVSRQSVINWT